MNFISHLTIWAIVFIKVKDVLSIEDGLEGQWSKFRYMASIWYKIDGRHKYICSGSIIGPKHILTAAHCVFNRPKEDFYVITGVPNIADIDLTDYREPPSVLTRWCCINFANSDCASISPVNEIWPHENYEALPPGPIKPNQRSYPANDIAVVVVACSITMDCHSAKIKLSTHDIDYGKECTVAGWGLANPCSAAPNPSPTLTYAIYQPVVKEECDEDRRDNEFCANPIEGYALKGDSGSPLVCEGDAVGVLVSGNEGFPAVFISTYAERKFIHDLLKDEVGYLTYYAPGF